MGVERTLDEGVEVLSSCRTPCGNTTAGSARGEENASGLDGEVKDAVEAAAVGGNCGAATASALGDSMSSGGTVFTGGAIPSGDTVSGRGSDAGVDREEDPCARWEAAMFCCCGACCWGPRTAGGRDETDTNEQFDSEMLCVRLGTRSATNGFTT